MNHYDVIVIGTGGVGSATLFHLAQRGRKVLGIDRFPGGHDRGSSHGQTRIIRQAYFEHPNYVPLLRRAYELWNELEERTGEQLYFPTGLFESGPPDGVVIPGVLSSANEHSLEIEELSQPEAKSKFPYFVVPDDDRVVFERRAGYLLVEQCVLAHLAQARQFGAETMNDSVLSWEPADSEIVVKTKANELRSKRVVVTAGAWVNDLLTDLGLQLRVLIKHLHWYQNPDRRLRQDEGCPTFFFEVPAGYYYGFPQLDDRGVKIAEHSQGVTVNDPLGVDRSVDPDERRRVELFLANHLPSVSANPTDHTTCFYTMSPDEHFVVDVHPAHPEVVFGLGLSGHGFKFSPVLGEILADLVEDGRTKQPIGFLSCQRPAIQ